MRDSGGKLHSNVLPLSRKRRKYEDHPVGAEKLAQVVMGVVLHTSRRDWFDEDALRGLSALTNEVVSGGRIHARPRRRTFDHRRHKAKNRLSILLFSTGACRLVDDETERKTQKMNQNRVGCTFFYSDRPVGDENQEVYINTWDGMMEASLPYQDIADVKAVFMEWFAAPGCPPADPARRTTRSLTPSFFRPARPQKVRWVNQ